MMCAVLLKYHQVLWEIVKRCFSAQLPLNGTKTRQFTPWLPVLPKSSNGYCQCIGVPIYSRITWRSRNWWIYERYRPYNSRGDIWLLIINSLWLSDTIWRHRTWSPLAQIMVCCLKTPIQPWINVELSSVKSCGIYMGAIWNKNKSIIRIYCKIAPLKLPRYVDVDNELNECLLNKLFSRWPYAIL